MNLTKRITFIILILQTIPSLLLSVPVLNRTELEDFSNRYFEKKINQKELPGAVISVVKDGRLIFQKGYGYSDLENQIPFDPDSSVITLGTLAKLLTFISIQKLADQKLIRLEDDVSKYTGKFQPGDPKKGELTFQNLLSHTDGYESRLIGIASVDAKGLRTLKETTESFEPAQLYSPGEFLTYGDYGATLCGYLIERISGKNYSQYIEENIFRKLGMDKSRITPDLPENNAINSVSGYAFSSNGIFKKTKPLFIQSMPAGGLKSTASDMAKLMNALLEKGLSANGRLLSQKSLNQILNVQLRSHIDIAGVSYGLFEHTENGRTLFIRDGDGIGIRSRMILDPENHLGIFIAYNIEDDGLRFDFLSEYLNTYYPQKNKTKNKEKNNYNALEEFTGTYRVLNQDRSTPASLLSFFSGEIQIKKNKLQGLTVIPGAMGDSIGGFEGETNWSEIKKDVFLRNDKNTHIAFGRDSKGSVKYLYSAQGYHGSYRKLKFYETSIFHITLIILTLSIFIFHALSVFLYWPARTLLKFMKEKDTLRARLYPSTFMRFYGGICAFLMAYSFIRVFSALFTANAHAEGYPVFIFGMSVEIISSLSFLKWPFILSIPLPFFLLYFVRKSNWSKTLKIEHAFFIFMIPLYIFFLAYWKLV